MEIVHIAAELAPTAKVGGLGDVLFGLCRAQRERGHQVKVFIPKYDCLLTDKIKDYEVYIPNFLSYFEGKQYHNRIWKGIINGFPVFFFETNDPYGFFERGTIYGCLDDCDRFLYFNRLVLEYIHKQKILPDILHVHDWHTAAIPFLQDLLYKADSNPKTVLTIHNLAYQGMTNPAVLAKVGVPEEILLLKGRQSLWNLLEEGITYADHITTVSPTYADEILTPMGGKGLDQHLIKHRAKLSGLLNGIDEKFWDPQQDPVLEYHYGPQDITLNHPPFIKNKDKLQKLVRHMLFLEQKRVPLVGCITRLVPQKSPDLIKQALLWTLAQGGQFILLGSAFDPMIHEEFYALKRHFIDSRDLHIELVYNENLSHILYAAADILLVPSLFEPCGLTQLIAMRYGTVPLVRKTGGLADTVIEGENGFLFGPPTKEALEKTLKRAFYTWYHEPNLWRSMIHKGMHTDFSWSQPAEKYLSIYKALRGNCLVPT